MVNSERHSENRLSQAALGRALGLSPAAVTKLKGQGMPVDSLESAQAWRAARQNVAQRKPAPQDAALGKPWAPWRDPGRDEKADAPPAFLDEDRDAARTRREIAEANMAEMLEAKTRRDLIRVASVQTQLAADYATTRDAVLQIPARLGPLLAAESDPARVQTLLHAELHAALSTLAGAADRVPNIEGGFD